MITKTKFFLKGLLLILFFQNSIYSEKLVFVKVKKDNLNFSLVEKANFKIFTRGDIKEATRIIEDLTSFQNTQYSKYFSTVLNEPIPIFLYKNKKEYLLKRIKEVN